MAPTYPFAIVIPALDEAGTIADLARRALAQTPHVIVVDDGSRDGTAAALADLPVTLLRHETTRGKGASLADGFREALTLDVRAAITLDGDGQHRPEDIPSFVTKALREPGTIVIGSRAADRASFPPAPYRANRVADFWISWASGYLVDDSQSGFRLYPREVLERVAAPSSRARSFVFESEMLINAARAGFRSRSVPIPALYGETTRGSHFRPVLDIVRIVIMVAGKLLAWWMYPLGLYRVYVEWRRAAH